MNTTNQNISVKNNESEAQGKQRSKLRGGKTSASVLWRVEDLARGTLIGCVLAESKDEAMKAAYTALLKAEIIPPIDGLLVTKTATATGELL